MLRSFSARFATFHKFESDVSVALMRADIVHLHDVGMLHFGEGFRFGLEAGELSITGKLASENHLEGDDAIESNLPGFVDDTHAAPAQFTEDFIPSDGRVIRPRLTRRGRNRRRFSQPSLRAERGGSGLVRHRRIGRRLSVRS